jgi:[protein-PII] uridylyltransferase
MKTETLVKELKEKKEELSEIFLAKGESCFQKKLSDLYDDYFMKSFEYISDISNSLNTPFAVVALGGYGRQEQAPHSDIDILFLFENKPEEEADKIIKEILYPLWDYKFTIGHSTRTINECLKEAKSDIFNLTAMLDSRFICGFSPLYIRFAEKFRNYLSLNSRKLTEDIFAAAETRHREYGNSEYLLEPDIKSGMGGLRDYHTMRWIAKVHFDLQELKDFLYHGYLSETEYPEFLESLSFISRVRNNLHFLTNRKCDKLHFDHQLRIANKLGFSDKEGKTSVENFLGELHTRLNYLKEFFLMIKNESGRPRKLGIKRVYQKTTSVKDLEIKNSLIGFKSPEKILNDPSLLVKIFKESGLKKVPINSESKRLVWDFGYLAAQDKFRKNQDNISAFEKIMSIPYMDNHPLDSMLNTGFLGVYIPEFTDIANRIQYNDYHIYPVARHSIRAVQAVQELISEKGSLKNSDLYASVYSEIKPKRVLLWAVLLHDIGKGTSDNDHSISGAEMVKKILPDFNMKKEHIDNIAFLVENHLYLVKTATRRDIFDEETINACAVKIKSAMRLKMLYLLTLADSKATGPKAWSEWNESLITSLFLKTLKVLEKGNLSGPNAIRHLEKKTGGISALLKEYTDNPEAILSNMPATYVFELPESDILIHAKLYTRLKNSGKPFVFEVEKNKDSGLRRVFFCADDRPGFFSKAAGIFTVNNMDILDARAFSWKNSTALSIFTVSAPLDTVYEERIWNKTEKDLEKVLNNEFDLASAVMNKKSSYGIEDLFNTKDIVKTDNDSSSFYSIVEVHTVDYPGLLYDLTNILYKCGTDIKSAKIATKTTQVVDVFYLSSVEGEKISSEKASTIEKEILRELSEIKEAV